MKITELKRKLEIFDKEKKNIGKKMLVSSIIFCSVSLLSFLIMIITYPDSVVSIILILINLFVYFSYIIYLSVKLSKASIVCPSCKNAIKYERYGNSSKVDILRNMHQCPFCQYKFV